MKKPKRPPLPRCGDKVCYPNERAAVRTLLRQAWRSGASLRWYACPMCGAWHLTSKALQNRPAKAAERHGDEQK